MPDNQSQAFQVWQETVGTIFEKEKLTESFGVMSFVFILFTKSFTVFKDDGEHMAHFLERQDHRLLDYTGSAGTKSLR